MLGVDHFGKNQLAGTRGAASKESAGDLVLACLGDKELSGSVTNTRLAVRKNRGGQQGQEFPFTLRVVEAPEPDEDGEPITTMVVDWQPAARRSSGTAGSVGPMPAPGSAHGGAAAEAGADGNLGRSRCRSANGPDGPMVRMVDQEIVREQFYSHTPAEGTPKQKRQLRSLQFKRALGWAEDQQLIGIEEIDGVTYLRLSRPDREEEENE